MTPVDFLLFGIVALGCTLVGYLAGLEEGKQKAQTESGGAANKPKPISSAIRFFEVMFDDGYSIAIKATRRPLCAEAYKFTLPDNKRGHAVTEIVELTENEVRQFFDCTHIDNWPVFQG